MMDWQISKSSLSSRFEHLLHLNQWTDCTFAVGDEHVEIISCHKLVLAVSSPVFEALFFGPLADTSNVIEVPDIDPAIFKLMLNYLYCDHIDFESIAEAGEVLYCAKKYIINHLIQICLKYLGDNLHISTLWETLAVAETLYEEDLQTRCIKIMSLYPSDIWLSKDVSMNQSTLSRLLDESFSNLTELELWNLVTTWAQQECELKNLPVTSENKRFVLKESGMLKKIRFFTLSQKEIDNELVPSGLLTDDELDVINTYRVITNKDKSIYIAHQRFELNLNLTRREPMANRMFLQGFRSYLSKRKIYTNGPVTVYTQLSSTSRILLSGIEVFTKIPSSGDYYLGRGKAEKYTEKFDFRIIDEERNVLYQSTHIRIHCAFNTVQKVMLSKPIWLDANKKYKIEFDLSDGQYPLYDLSSDAYSKSVYLTLEDCVQYSGADCCSIKLSFLNSVIFNI